MKRMLTALIALVVLPGCVMISSPAVGSICTAVKHPLGAPGDGQPVKEGQATATGVLGFAIGDCSIEAACKQAGITKIHSVDGKALNILGIYGTYTTIVRGE